MYEEVLGGEGGRGGGGGWETEDGRRGEGEVRWERGEAMVMEI